MYGGGVCERFVSFVAQSKDGMFIYPNKIFKKLPYAAAKAIQAIEMQQSKLL
jgi:hypothetical protein